MTLILKLDLDMVKMYLHTKNKVSMSSVSKVIAWTDRHTDRQTHRQTDMTENITYPHTRLAITDIEALLWYVVFRNDYFDTYLKLYSPALLLLFVLSTKNWFFSIASAMVVFNFGDGLISHAPWNSPIAFGDANNARIEVAPDPCPSNLTCNETSNVTLISKVWFCGFNGWVLGISFKYIGSFWNLSRKLISKHFLGSSTQNFTILTISNYFSN